jgi:hypothetical protein
VNTLPMSIEMKKESWPSGHRLLYGELIWRCR